MDMAQKTTPHTMILAFLLFSIGMLLSSNTFAAPKFATKALLNAQMAAERVARAAADTAETTARTAADTKETNARTASDNALSAAITSSVHFIGDSYGGGKVFYVYDGGHHGLIAALADQDGGGGIRWYGGSDTNTRARADGVGAGKANTAIIIANQGPFDGNAFAATVCNEYSATDAEGVTYGDWYLPSKHELNLLRQQKGVVGGFADTIATYWSSTENSSTNAWSQSFALDANQILNLKSSPIRVRAVRAF